MNPIEVYISEANPAHQEDLSKLRIMLRDTPIPLGYEERISYGILGYVVPYSLYTQGYHCKPEIQLPFITLASRKSWISLYHMGMWASPELLEWWKSEYKKRNTWKLYMGVGCIRFKKLETIPYDLITELMGKISATEWI